MSTTFTCPESPRTECPCPWCAEAYERGEAPNEHGGYCDPWCDGILRGREAPEVNIGFGAIGGLLRLLGLPGGDNGDLYGRLLAEDMADFRRRILKALNGNREACVVAPYEQAGGHAGTKVTRDADGTPRIQRMGCAVVNFGITDEQTVRRLTDLDKLAQYAQEKGYGISWS